MFPVLLFLWRDRFVFFVRRHDDLFREMIANRKIEAPVNRKKGKDGSGRNWMTVMISHEGRLRQELVMRNC